LDLEERQDVLRFNDSRREMKKQSSELMQK
jgi:hypothetical protein